MHNDKSVAPISAQTDSLHHKHQPSHSTPFKAKSHCYYIFCQNCLPLLTSMGPSNMVIGDRQSPSPHTHSTWHGLTSGKGTSVTPTHQPKFLFLLNHQITQLCFLHHPIQLISTAPSKLYPHALGQKLLPTYPP